MAKIVDLFTGKPMDSTTEDTKSNDKAATEVGVYVGHMHKTVAKRVRDAKVNLDVVSERFTQTQRELNDVAAAYLVELLSTLKLLGIEDDFEPSEKELIISENGHVWAVPIERAALNLFEELNERASEVLGVFWTKDGICIDCGGRVGFSFESSTLLCTGCSNKQSIFHSH